MVDVKELLVSQDRHAVEAWCRSKTQNYSTGGTVTARVLGKYLMVLDSNDRSMVPHLVLDGYWQMWVTQALARNVKPGMRCYEAADSRQGYYTVLLADLVGEQGEMGWWCSSMITSQFEVSLIACSLRMNGLDSSGPKRRIKVAFDDHELERDFVMLSARHDNQILLETLTGTLGPTQMLLPFIPETYKDPRQFLAGLQGAAYRLYTVGHDSMIRKITLDEALIPDTGPERTLWISRAPHEPR